MGRTFAVFLFITTILAVWFSIVNSEVLEIGFLNLISGTWNINQIIVRLFSSALILVSLNAFYHIIKKKSSYNIYWLGMASAVILLFSTLNAPAFVLSQNIQTIQLSVLAAVSALVALLVFFGDKDRIRLFSSALKQKIAVSVIVAFALILPYILSPIFPVYFEKKPETNERLQDFFSTHAISDGIIGDAIDRKLVLFASPNCPHCNRVKLYLATALSNGELHEDNLTIVYPENTTLSEEYKSAFEYPLPEMKVSQENFIKYTGGRFPLVYLYANDKVKMQWHTTGFTYSDIPIIKRELKKLKE